jgi:MFS family permease
VVVATVLGIRTPVWPIRGPDSVATGRRPLLHHAALTPGVVLVLTITGLSAFQTFVALHVDELGMSGAGGVFLVYSVLVLGVRVLGASVPDRLGARRVAGAGIVMGAVGLFVIAIAPGATGLYAGVVIMALGISPVYPALLSLVIADTPEDQRGAAMGTFSLFFDLSQGVGLPILGAVAALTNERGAFAAGAVLQLVGFAVLRLRVPAPPSVAPLVSDR